MPARAMRRNAIAALLSGPAAGVVGAIRQAKRSGRGDLITFDMGGTSTDVSLVQGGEPALAPETEVDGLPIRTPVLDIVTVGAGGGSLVWIDDGGMLRAGPQRWRRTRSSLLWPRRNRTHGDRRACCARHHPPGCVPRRRHAARRRCRAPVIHGTGRAARHRCARRTAAAIRLAVANIVRAIQLVSTERGRDPRDYALLPFGGAGPLLAAEIADEIGINEILVPPNPGVISALGLLSADYVKVYGVTRRMRLGDDAPAVLRDEHARFSRSAEAEFRELGLAGHLEHTLEVDMRFVGQAFEIPVAVDPASLATLRAAELAERFAEAHRRVYLHGGEPGRHVEMVALRFGVRRRLDDLPNVQERPAPMNRPATTQILTGAPNATANMSVTARIIEASQIGTETLSGPALIEGYSSTTWVPPGWTAARDQAGNVMLRREPR